MNQGASRKILGQRGLTGLFTAVLSILAAQIEAGFPPTIVSQWGTEGTADGMLFQPRDLVALSDGGILVLDMDRLQKFSADGALVFVTRDGYTSAMDFPGHLTIDDTGAIYVLDLSLREVHKFDASGSLLGGWRPLTYNPTEIAFSGGHIYVMLDGLRRYSLEGEFDLLWPPVAAGDGLGVDPDGHLISSSTGLVRIDSVDGTMTPLFDYGYVEGRFSGSHADIAVDPTGTIYVADSSEWIRVFDSTGLYRGRWGLPRDIHGIDIDDQGYIVTCGVGSPAITRFAPVDVLPPPPPPPEAYKGTVMLHLQPAESGRFRCDSAPDSIEQIVTVGEAQSSGNSNYFVYLLASPATHNGGVAGLQFGIEYTEGTQPHEGLLVNDWRACSGLVFSDDLWPASASGITLTWDPFDGCQRDPVFPAGIFYATAYSASTFSIVGFPLTQLVKLADCRAAEFPPSANLGMDHVGWISFRGGRRGTDTDGCNPALEPCLTTPAEPTTWGQIKARYR